MGASFIAFTLKGDRKSITEQFEKAQNQDRYENGHCYSGGIGMATGLTFTNQAPFPGEALAEAWLSDNCEKWEDALAVPLMPASDNVWMIGAVCAS